MPAGGELELTKLLNGQVHTFDAYLAAHKARYRFYHLHEQVVVDWFKAIDANETGAAIEALVKLATPDIKIEAPDGLFNGTGGLRQWAAAAFAPLDSTANARRHTILAMEATRASPGAPTAEVVVQLHFKAKKSDGSTLDVKGVATVGVAKVTGPERWAVASYKVVVDS